MWLEYEGVKAMAVGSKDTEGSISGKKKTIPQQENHIKLSGVDGDAIRIIFRSDIPYLFLFFIHKL